MVGATQDVTERLRAEQARESERLRLRHVLAQMPASVSVHEGPGQVFVALSDAMQRQLGGREVLGLPAREAIPELAAQGLADELERVYHTGEPLRASAVRAWWDADGDGVPEEHVVDYTYHPLRDAEGRVYGVVSHLADVTARDGPRASWPGPAPRPRPAPTWPRAWRASCATPTPACRRRRRARRRRGGASRSWPRPAAGSRPRSTTGRRCRRWRRSRCRGWPTGASWR